jgi:hypothetical protein
LNGIEAGLARGVAVGLWGKLFARARNSGEQIDISVSISTGDLVEIAGTTTFAKEGAIDAAARHADRTNGYAEVRGVVVGAASEERAPTADVLVDGVRIGALPGYLAQELTLKPGLSFPVIVQLLSENGPTGRRVDAWAWLGPGAPRWRYGPSSRPPTTTEERAKETHDESRRMVAEGLAAGGTRAEQFRAGMVDGFHYLELVEPIKQLKREGRLDEALQLCYLAIQGAENARNGREPAPAYTIDAAIIHRKLKQRDEEIAVLQRWIDHCPPKRRAGSQIAARLAKLTI